MRFLLRPPAPACAAVVLVIALVVTVAGEHSGTTQSSDEYVELRRDGAPRVAEQDLAPGPFDGSNRQRHVINETAVSLPVAPNVSRRSVQRDGVWRFCVGTRPGWERPEGHGFVVEIAGASDRPPTEVLRGRTDESGDAIIDWIPDPSVDWSEVKRSLRCRLTDPGMISHVVEFRPRGLSKRPRPCAYIKPRMGIEATVQLVDSNGINVAGSYALETPTEFSIGWKLILETDSNGFARIQVPQGMEATLRGSSPDVGTAAIRFEDLAKRAAESQPVALVVNGPGSIAGLLLSAAGEPMPGIELTLRSAPAGPTLSESPEASDGTSLKRPFNQLTRSYSRAGGGSIRVAPVAGVKAAVTTTDERGEFTAHGLALGSFIVHDAQSDAVIGHLNATPRAPRVPMVWNRVFVRIAVAAQSPDEREFDVEVQQHIESEQKQRWNSHRNIGGPRSSERLSLHDGSSMTAPSAPFVVAPGVAYKVKVAARSRIVRSADGTITTGGRRLMTHTFSVDSSRHEWIIVVPQFDANALRTDPGAPAIKLPRAVSIGEDRRSTVK